jgi:hypothetical protein
MPFWKFQNGIFFLNLKSVHRKPPAITSVSPVIQEASFEAKNTAAGAMSLTSPTRPSGVCAST